MVIVALVATSALLAVVVLATAWRRADAAARLPAPPVGAGPSVAIAEHLRGRYDAAVDAPTSGAAVGALCVAYHADMYFDLAERCYVVASNLEPGEWRWRYYHALIQAERGGGQALVASLRTVVADAPRFAPAWLRLGDAEFKAGRYDAAAEAWRRAAELPEPERRLRASGFGAQGGTTQPVYIVEAPVAAYASLGLARIALQQGDASGASRMFEAIAGRFPGFSSAFRLLAEAYRLLGRDSDAARAVSRANRLPPFTPYVDPVVDTLARESRNSTFLLRLASEANLSINGQWSEFLARRATELEPDNPEAVVKLGRVLRTLERNQEALEWFQKYHRMVPEDVQGLAHIGSCLSALGRYAEAESFLKRALAGLDDPVTHYNLGLLMAVTGRPTEAVEEYERALEGDPANSDARGNLAAALVRLGQLDRASRELARVLEYDSENPTARTNLGLVMLQQGRPGAAVEQFRHALRIDPGFAPAAEALRSLAQDSGNDGAR
jgi:tetratricopeptide (TPR) repeat protein